MADKTGLVALVGFVVHICRLLTTWRTKMDAAIAAAVTSGAITSAQATQLETWLDAAQGACSILRLITGY